MNDQSMEGQGVRTSLTKGKMVVTLSQIYHLGSFLEDSSPVNISVRETLERSLQKEQFSFVNVVTIRNYIQVYVQHNKLNKRMSILFMS